MLMKTCPYCQNASFSSTTLGGPWLCPSCGEDITHTPVEAPHRPVQTGEDANGKNPFDSVRKFFRKLIKAGS